MKKKSRSQNYDSENVTVGKKKKIFINNLFIYFFKKQVLSYTNADNITEFWPEKKEEMKTLKQLELELMRVSIRKKKFFSLPLSLPSHS